MAAPVSPASASLGRGAPAKFSESPSARHVISSARPDRSIALKAAHEAAQADEDYDRWFRAKVQKSQDGIKDGSNRLYTEAEWKVLRADMVARIKARQAL